MALLFKPGKKAEQISPKNGEAFQLNEAQSLVGGWVEVVFLNNDIMLVDEEGLCKGKPYNAGASEYASENNPDNQIYSIVGTAIVCRITEF